jgi:hypothetical protein
MTDELASLTNRVKSRCKNISRPGKFSFLCRNTISFKFGNKINNLSDGSLAFPYTSAVLEAVMIAATALAKN